MPIGRQGTDEEASPGQWLLAAIDCDIDVLLAVPLASKDVTEFMVASLRAVALSIFHRKVHVMPDGQPAAKLLVQRLAESLPGVVAPQVSPS